MFNLSKNQILVFNRISSDSFLAFKGWSIFNTLSILFVIKVIAADLQVTHYVSCPSVYGRVSQLSSTYLFLCIFYAILRYKSFKIRGNFSIELLKIYENMVLTSFLELFQPHSMRISLIMHLNFVHIKPQQPNCFDSCTDTTYL